MKTISRKLLAMMGMLLFAPMPTTAQHLRCDHCGCQAECRRICRVESTEKEISTTHWGIACEEFCIPGPTLPMCKHCETVCDDAKDDKAPFSRPKRLQWTQWGPGNHAWTKNRAKLMKRIVTKKVPCFKWVTEDLCAECQEALAAKAPQEPSEKSSNPRTE